MQNTLLEDRLLITLPVLLNLSLKAEAFKFKIGFKMLDEERSISL